MAKRNEIKTTHKTFNHITSKFVEETYTMNLLKICFNCLKVLRKYFEKIYPDGKGLKMFIKKNVLF